MTNPKGDFVDCRYYHADPIINEGLNAGPGSGVKGIGFCLKDDLGVVLGRQAMSINGPITIAQLAEGLRDLATAIESGVLVKGSDILVGNEAVTIGKR